MTLRARAFAPLGSGHLAYLVCAFLASACDNPLLVATGAGADRSNEAGDVSLVWNDGDGSTDAADSTVPGDASIHLDDAAPEAQADVLFNPGCAVCPASAPEAGAPCSSAGLQTLECEYGSDPRPIANVFAHCQGGRWSYDVAQSFPLADSGLPVGDAGCPPTFVEAGLASSCDVPTCAYPEGMCTCYVAPGINSGDAGTFWSCPSVPLPAGCPATLAEAQDGGSCPGSLECFYAGGTCHCYGGDGGSQTRCTIPGAGCPTTRPRIGSPCDPAVAQHCTYIPVGCGELRNGDLFCRVPQAAGDASSCEGVWVSNPSPPVCAP